MTALLATTAAAAILGFAAGWFLCTRFIAKNWDAIRSRVERKTR